MSFYVAANAARAIHTQRTVRSIMIVIHSPAICNISRAGAAVHIAVLVIAVLSCPVEIVDVVAYYLYVPDAI